MNESNTNTAILLIHCPDRPGIVAAVTSFLSEHEGNVLYLDQHVDRGAGVFFMRLEWELEKFTIPIEALEQHLDPLVRQFKMTWRLYLSDMRPRMAIFVSKIPHCLDDILARYQSGEWKVDIPLVISNHETQKDTVRKFGPNFYCFPKHKENKAEQEQQELKLLKEYSINFIVLARYMQILSNDFVSHYRNRIINIHHSFLPAFPGSKPYHSAYDRGVKIIGATSHYVTEDLDEGPIIDQDVARVSHRDSVSDMVRIGRDLEKIVLARAIYAHLSRKVMVYQNKTIVFS
ncbi:MAG: formyltetrahydrofolate deformylase [Bacteroides sp. SM23_62]|nr:MAG: formyltetrahydrofolate deformylase [Bacteroides sp. SM23_62]